MVRVPHHRIPVANVRHACAPLCPLVCRNTLHIQQLYFQVVPRRSVDCVGLLLELFASFRLLEGLVQRLFPNVWRPLNSRDHPGSASVSRPRMVWRQQQPFDAATTAHHRHGSLWPTTCDAQLCLGQLVLGASSVTFAARSHIVRALLWRRSSIPRAPPRCRSGTSRAPIGRRSGDASRGASAPVDLSAGRMAGEGALM